MANSRPGAERWADLLVDLNQKFRAGSITADQLEWFNNLSNPKRDSMIRTKSDVKNKTVDTVAPGSDLIAATYDLTIDYSKSFNAMIAAGRYDINRGKFIHGKFLIRGEGKVIRKAHLVHFKCELASDEVVFQLYNDGKRPATIDELLAFGAQYPDVQRKFPVAALGSSKKHIRGNRWAPYISANPNNGPRIFSLESWDNGWEANVRFLAVYRDDTPVAEKEPDNKSDNIDPETSVSKEVPADKPRWLL